MNQRIEPSWEAPANVHAFTTTREGGISRAPFDSFNLGARCGDEPARVHANRNRFQLWLPSSPGWLRQVHGRQVVDRSKFAEEEPEADAAVAFSPGLACTILTADCLPVLFCDREGSRVAAAHAGWRGLAGGVLEATVTALETDPANLVAWLGPGIGPKAFEVGAEVREQFLSVYPGCSEAFETRDGSLFADLYAIARLALADAGVSRVSGGQHCTHADQNRFYSYRRDGRTGRMATVIWFE